MSINKHDKVRVLPNNDIVNGYATPSFFDTKHEIFSVIFVEKGGEDVWLDNGYTYPVKVLELVT